MEIEQLSTKQENNNFNIKRHLLRAIAYWYLFVLSFIIIYGYKFVNDRYRVNTYSTHATIILKDELQSTQRVVGGLQLFNNRKNIENEIGVLKSYSLSEAAIKELDFDFSYFKYEKFRSDIDLYQNSPFIIIPDSGKYFTEGINCYLAFTGEDSFNINIEKYNINQELHFGEHFSSDHFNFTVVKNDKINIDYKKLKGNTYYFHKNNFHSLVNSFSNRLNVDVRSQNSSILWLWMDGTVPQRINNYLNKVIEVYLRKRLEEKNRIVINTIKIIDSQLANVVDSIVETEDSLQLFKQNNQVLDITKEGEMLFDDLAELQSELKLLNLKKNFYLYLKKNMNKNTEIPEIVSPMLLNINDPILTAYTDEYMKLKSEADILKYDVKSDIPSYNILKIKLSKIKENIKKHIETSIKATEYSINETYQKTNNINAKLRKIPSVQRQIKNIQRKYKLHDNIYSFLLERRTEAGITIASNSPGAKIIDNARNENIVRAAKSETSNAKYFLFALFIPYLIIVILDFFNNKIVDKSEIEKTTNIPIIGTISKNIVGDKIPVENYPRSPIAESFRSLKVQMNFLLKNKDKAVILISSTLSGEGKSFISVNLATLLAKNRKKTLVIGLDLRKPTIQKTLNIQHTIGISSYLTNFNTLDEIIFKTNIDNLYLIPSGQIPPNPAELIESSKMQELIQKLKEDFTYIVIDTPPIAYVADTFLLTRYADVNLFVLRQNYSPKNVLKILDDIHTSGRVKNMGIIFNDVNQSAIYGLKKGYGFNYGYGYGFTDDQTYFEEDAEKQNLINKLRKKFYTGLKRLFN